MTAEVAILNRHGVALAADSAVTVSHPGGQKVYNSVNKLFTLSKYAPVGIMVFGAAELTSVPWETIIKSFRSDLGDQRFDHLREYADSLFDYIRSHSFMFAEEQQAFQIAQSAFLQFRDILVDIDSQAEAIIANDGQISDTRFKRIAGAVITAKHAEWMGYDKLPNAPTDHPRWVRRKWTKNIQAAIELLFENTPLTARSKSLLVEIASLALVTDQFPDNVSGVVVAGFGDSEYFPRLYTFDVEGVVLNFIKMREDENRSVEVGPFNRASIVPFAQREMVSLFMEGIDPDFRGLIYAKLAALRRGLPAAVAAESGAKGKAAEDLRKTVRSAVQPMIDEYVNELNQHLAAYHVDPIVSSVQALPKEEIAAMAESLVSLTSFKRRVTQAPETVGGPVDVAVISKGDGFIWIKRKHYFDPALNHHFFSNYYDGGVEQDD